MKVEFGKELFHGGIQRALKESKGDFLEDLKHFIRNVNEKQVEADEKVKEFVAGKRDITEVMVSLAKADLSFRLLLQVRNKAVEAFQEIMRIQA